MGQLTLALCHRLVAFLSSRLLLMNGKLRLNELVRNDDKAVTACEGLHPEVLFWLDHHR